MRLIDADELLKKLEPYGLTRGFNLGGHSGTTEILMDIVKKQPTVDAVEVVRCKDCKRSYIYKQKNEGMVYCAIHGMSKNGNGFCEEGVPKDGD